MKNPKLFFLRQKLVKEMNTRLVNQRKRVINWSTRLIMDRRHSQNIWQHLSRNKRNLVMSSGSSFFVQFFVFFFKIFQHVLHVNWLPINCFAMKSIPSHYIYFIYIYILITLYTSFLFFVISPAPSVNFVRKYSLDYN